MLVDDATYLTGRRVDVGHGGDFTWIALVDPDPLELDGIRVRLGFHELVAEDALSGCQRPKLDSYPDHEILLLKTISYDEPTKRVMTGDISVIYGSNYVVTVRHGDSIPLRSIRLDLEARPDRLARGATAVVHEILDRLVDHYVEVCRHLSRDVSNIEDEVFGSETAREDAAIYFVKRELIEFRRATRPLIEPLERLVDGRSKILDDDYHIHFSDVLDHLRRVVDEVEGMNELMTSAISANLALVQVRQNADMRRISAWVGIGAVPTMIAGLYGMNFSNMPELQWRYGYFIVLSGLLLVCGLLFTLFRRYRWL